PSQSAGTQWEPENRWGWSQSEVGFADSQPQPSTEHSIQVRLAGDKRKHNEGRAEVYYNSQWGTICDDDFSIHSANVFCRQLGYVEAVSWYPGSKYGKGEGPIWLDNLYCTGRESSIAQCTSNGWGVSDCKHTEDVSVLCSEKRIPGFRSEDPLLNQIEVSKGGAQVGEGRLEVLMNGEWGTICDDGWSLHSASVACRELGFGTAKEAILGARLGQGIGPIHLNEMDCTGFEKSITDCKFSKEIRSCTHEEDAGVRCNIPAMGFQTQIRLNGGRTPYEGQVQILHEHNGTLIWGSICGEGWDIMDAMVVCRQLNLGYASHAFQETWYWYGDTDADNVVVSGMKCSGTEMALSHCPHDAKVSCPKGGGRYAAGVSCTETAADLVLNAKEVEETSYLEDRPMNVLQCAMEENCLASSAVNTSVSHGIRRLFRFSSEIHNNGQADFRPKTGRHAWIWHECHRHYHSMEVFAHYDLLDSNWTQVAEGHKASFCLEDSNCIDGVQKQYECANFGEQGISVGCYDVYRHDIDCQWIDVTDLKQGDYIFRIIVNPNFEVAESDYSNNVMLCNVRYGSLRVWVYNCHIGKLGFYFSFFLILNNYGTCRDKLCISKIVLSSSRSGNKL
uniref:Lysyl oxidase homolog n=1 Tax=Pseudonaja textilis TaxID=8673 RepID=A0A670Z5V7_PSETE